jgi:hypothetical protein
VERDEAEAVGNAATTSYYLLTAYTTDAAGTVISSQGLRVYVS